jgi:NHLM bacteriocin system ABC transporter peptidase/ATP-binding protein
LDRSSRSAFHRTPRKRTSTVLQMEAVECGAAALSMVLRYYGKYVSLEELRMACGVSRDGTKASNILKAARNYGLQAKGFSKQPAELCSLPLPAIIFWNFNHFVVVEGFRPAKVYLNDPASGPRVVSEDEFEQGFTGVVLVLQPGPDFERGGSEPRMASALRARLRGSGTGLIYVVLVSLALAILGLIVPVFAKVFVDYVLVREYDGWVVPLLIGLLVTAILRAGVTWVQRYYLLRLSLKLAVTSSYRFLWHLLRLPMEFFTQRYCGEVGARMEINDRIARVLSGDLAVNVLNILVVAIYASLMWYFDVVLTLIALTFAALNFVTLSFVARRRKDINGKLLQERGKLIGVSMAGLQGIESLKATGREHDFFSGWSGHLAKALNASQQMGVYSSGLQTVPFLLATLSTVAILGIGALRVLDGYMTVGTVVAFEGLMLGFMGPLNELVNLSSTFQEVEGELRRLDDVLEYPTERGLQTETLDLSDRTLPKLTGQLELVNVAYGYSRLDEPLIRGFNLQTNPGARVALVGLSASGKSTLAKLITGLYRPWEGQILFDGKPRDDVPRILIVNSIAMVDQDFFLYEGTVREVLTMWDPTISENDIIQAAKDACIHDEIAARPGGYDSKVEEGGRNFSHGQQQRLEIARSLVRNPTILVLDEATSALDPVTEKRIDENLRRRGCTCIIIAHRLSTIRDCDEIVVLDRGGIAQRGTHDAMHSINGPYHDLIRA